MDKLIIIIRPKRVNLPGTIFPIGTLRTFYQRTHHILGEREDHLFWNISQLQVAVKANCPQIELDIRPNRIFHYGFTLEIQPEGQLRPIYQAEFEGERGYRFGLSIKVFPDNVAPSQAQSLRNQPAIQLPTSIVFAKTKGKWPTTELRW